MDKGGYLLHKKLPIFYSALMLTGVNLLLRFVGTSFQVYLSGRIGAAGIGLLQLVMSVGTLAMVAGIAGIRTATMYLAAEELGKNRPQNITWVLSGCLLYSFSFSIGISYLLYQFAPWIAENWIADPRTVGALRLYAAFLPISCLCAVMTGYFTAANRIGTLAAVEVAEQAVSMVITIAALFLWAGTDPVRACQCIILGSCLGACLTLSCLIILRIREKTAYGAKIPVCRRILQSALPLATADNFKSGINTAENLMVPKRLAQCKSVSDPLAAFGMVSGMVFPLITFPMAILFGLAELLVPELARCNAAGSKDRIHYLVTKSLRVALIYGLCFGGLTYLLAEELCFRLYKTTEAAPYLQSYALLIPMLYCDCLTDAMVKGLGLQTVSVRYNIFTSSLDVLLLYILLPNFGMEGYFVSFLITHTVNFLLSLRLLLKITIKRIPVSVPILSAVAVVFSVWSASYVQNSVFRFSSFILILGSLLFLFRILSLADVRWVRNLIYEK